MATCAFATVGQARAGYTGATDAPRRPGVGGAGARAGQQEPERSQLQNSSSQAASRQQVLRKGPHHTGMGVGVCVLTGRAGGATRAEPLTRV